MMLQCTIMSDFRVALSCIESAWVWYFSLALVTSFLYSVLYIFMICYFSTVWHNPLSNEVDNSFHVLLLSI